jgi:hypothetical protein
VITGQRLELCVRRGLLNILTVAALALCAVSVALWVWSYRETRFLRSSFFYGRFDGDHTWRGHYLACFRGQIAFELEEIRYATRPTAAPVNRWSAEDAVGVRTPALRSFPFDGLLGFHYMRDRGVSEAGSLHVTRLALPLWAIVVASLLPICFRFRWLVRRRSGEKAAAAAAA